MHQRSLGMGYPYKRLLTRWFSYKRFDNRLWRNRSLRRRPKPWYKSFQFGYFIEFRLYLQLRRIDRRKRHSKSLFSRKFNKTYLGKIPRKRRLWLWRIFLIFPLLFLGNQRFFFATRRPRRRADLFKRLLGKFFERVKRNLWRSRVEKQNQKIVDVFFQRKRMYDLGQTLGQRRKFAKIRQNGDGTIETGIFWTSHEI